MMISFQPYKEALLGTPGERKKSWYLVMVLS